MRTSASSRARERNDPTTIALVQPDRRSGFSSVRSKLLATVLLTSIVSIAVGLTALWETSVVSRQGEAIYSTALVPNQVLSELRETVVQARFDVVSRALAKSPAAYRQANSDLKADEIRVAQLTASYRRDSLSARQMGFLKTFADAWVAYKSVRDNKMTPALLAGKLKLYEKVRTTELLPLVHTALGALNALSREAENGAKTRLHGVQRADSTAKLIVVSLLLLGLVVSLGLALAIANAIMRPVRLVRDILDSVAKNDLTRMADVQSRDELGQMAASLNTSITHLRLLHANLSQQALHDGLTGLPNRTALMQSLDELLQRGSDGFCVLFIDLDGFKSVNDREGHAAGDALLMLVAERIRTSLRSEGVVARLGGDEFLVLCHGLDDPQAAIAAAARITARLAEPFQIGSTTVSIGASIGIAMSNERSTSENLIEEADVAMYRSKVGGKGRFTLFDTGLPRSA
jgi:diguanylate cyclase (GGDEF)-like protein